jgi:putative transcriptional regulator
MHIEGLRRSIVSRTEVVPVAATPSVVAPEEVRSIRYRLRLSQLDFATMIGVSVSTLQGWEEGRHHPDGPAQALLRICAKSPRLVAKALGH